MTHLAPHALGTIAIVVLAACGAPPSANVAGSDVTANGGQDIWKAEPNSARERESATGSQSGMTPSDPPQDPSSPAPNSPPPLKSPSVVPAPPPQPSERVIRPAPDKAAAEVDPPHRYPGDEVPR